jgi:2'-5' RNA ligase
MASVRRLPQAPKPEIMRLFTGIDLPKEIKGNLEGLIEQLRPAARLKWSVAENFHLTTKFIGEWPEDRLEEIVAALRGLGPRAPIDIAIRGLGWFPNPHSPRVLWAGVDAPPALAELARATDEVVVQVGVPPETRSFAPHLTLARIRQPVGLAALRQAVAALPSDDFGAFTADRFHLYQSELRPSGSVYTKLAEFTFSLK